MAKNDYRRDMRLKIRKKTNLLRSFLKDESGMGTVEVILIIVVLIGLVIIFKNQLNSLVKTIFERITKQSGTVMS